MPSIDTIVKQESCEALLRQVFIHLRRAFRIGSRAKGIDNPVGALLIIKNEVEAISGILEHNRHVFLQHRTVFITHFLAVKMCIT